VKNNAPDEGFIKYLTLDKDEPGDYYGWGSLKYFLANYERELNKKVGKTVDMAKILAPENSKAKGDFYHKEHIWAKEEHSVLDDKNNLHINKRRLANFALLEGPLNKSAQAKPIDEKLKGFCAHGRPDHPNLKMLHELNGLYVEANKRPKESRTKEPDEKLHEYTKFFDSREEKLVNFALTRWKVEYPGHKDKTVTIDSFNERNEVYKVT